MGQNVLDPRETETFPKEIWNTETLSPESQQSFTGDEDGGWRWKRGLTKKPSQVNFPIHLEHPPLFPLTEARMGESGVDLMPNQEAV